MFRNVPGCSGMFRNVPCSWFYRRPAIYSQPRSRVNSISKNEMNIRISLCNVRRVNGMLDISLEIVPKKTH